MSDSVWPLIAVTEWVLGVLSRVMREVVMDRAKAEWGETAEKGASGSTRSLLTEAASPRILYFAHPSLRRVIIRLVAQVYGFVNFVRNLERPILQPESRFMPTGATRDPRATIVARELLEGIVAASGVDLALWGKALEGVEASGSAEALPASMLTTQGGASEDLVQSSLLNLDSNALRPFPLLPDPSSLFLSPPNEYEYDAITFLPLFGRAARCNRCGWKTAVLGQTTVGDEEVLRGWRKWRREREQGCGCGGCWVRIDQHGERRGTDAC